MISFSNVGKTFIRTTALANVSLEIAPGAIVGLVGRNGSGKSTLLQHVTGLQLPSTGRCTTFGVPTPQLGAAEFARMGVMQQHAKLLGWMHVSQLIAYVGSFYATWDTTLISSLVQRLQLKPQTRVGALSPGHIQSVSLILALAHRPALLLLDEPLSDLDPTTRREVVAILLEYYSSQECTMVVSSHLLHDIEPLINSVVCLAEGHVTAHDELDTLKEHYAEWVITPRESMLPTRWAEPYIVQAEGDERGSRLVVRLDPRNQTDARAAFVARYDADVEVRTMNLERLFPILTNTPVRLVGAHHG
ncbi:MAG: ABC transporter ATP-binding protein [Gemmatimonadaceae bacterium]|nr:ABC transporter ATP-binding protein [Gemmatimonadaceae bacterium]